MPQNADPAVIGDGPVSLPAHAVQMQGVRAHEGHYVSRDQERRRERAREREKERERELWRARQAPPKQVRCKPDPQCAWHASTHHCSVSLCCVATCQQTQDSHASLIAHTSRC